MLPAGDAGFPQPGLDVLLGFAGVGALRLCFAQPLALCADRRAGVGLLGVHKVLFWGVGVAPTPGVAATSSALSWSSSLVCAGCAFPGCPRGWGGLSPCP